MDDTEEDIADESVLLNKEEAIEYINKMMLLAVEYRRKGESCTGAVEKAEIIGRQIWRVQPLSRTTIRRLAVYLLNVAQDKK